MKPKPKPTVTPQLVQEAAAKLAQARRAADADVRLAKAAKGQLKSVKKTWKLARKAAKRSGKRVKAAEKILVGLQKKLKRILKRSQPKSTPGAKAPKKTGVRRRAPAKPAVAAAELTSPSSVAPASSPQTGVSSGEA